MQCNYDYSAQVLREALREAPPTLVAVIGCGCPVSTMAVADVPELRTMPVVRTERPIVICTMRDLHVEKSRRLGKGSQHVIQS